MHIYAQAHRALLPSQRELINGRRHPKGFPSFNKNKSTFQHIASSSRLPSNRMNLAHRLFTPFVCCRISVVTGLRGLLCKCFSCLFTCFLSIKKLISTPTFYPSSPPKTQPKHVINSEMLRCVVSCCLSASFRLQSKHNRKDYLAAGLIVRFFGIPFILRKWFR